jgi:DNA repair protein SbcD/Mre11
MIKILHTADVHLGREFPLLREKGREHRNQLLRTFERVIDLAINEKVSILLIAGDLFDTNHVYGIIIGKVLAAFEKLKDKGIPVCILPGTHDAYNDDSIYRFLHFPPNVTILTPGNQKKVYTGLDLTVYGKPFNDKLIGESAVRGLTIVKKSSFHVGMAHCSIRIQGFVENDSMILDRSEIANCGFDYLALGHWHSFKDFSQGDTKAFYCGSPEPITMDQKDAGNVALVTIYEKGNVAVEPVRIGTRRIDAISIDVGLAKSVDNIIKMVEERADPNLILKVTLTGLCRMDCDLNFREIEDQLAGQFFCLLVVDESHPQLEEVSSEIIPEETVAGKFVGLMRQRIASTSQENDKDIYEEALKLGFAILQGRTQVIE